MDREKRFKITNRDSGTVGYKIPEMGIRRQFQPKESKEVSFEEIEKLSFLPGGETMLRNFLLIEDEEARNAIFLNDVEPEYFYTEKEIDELLLNGSLQSLLDCLDFAPKGVIEILKKRAVDLEVPDIRKRNAIYEKTGQNINSAIEFNKETEKVEKKEEAKRRVPIENKAKEEPKRRIVPNKYDIVE